MGLLSSKALPAIQSDNETTVDTEEIDDWISITKVASKVRRPPNNLNGLLDNIYNNFISLKDAEFNHHYSVFCNVFDKMNMEMKEVDKYYRHYSNRKQFAGSHYDGLRISKPDEFDMDIIIGMPINYKVNPKCPTDSDIVIEEQCPGYVQLKMGVQFQKLPDRENWDTNKTAYRWMDESSKYLLRSKFQYWFKSVVNKALNRFSKISNTSIIHINGVAYSISISESGPAMTLFIKNKNFKCDIDLVPALRFPEARWPVSPCYRDIPNGCHKDYWMVVPKPNKSAVTVTEEQRSWRIALHDQEYQFIYRTERLRQCIRFIKKLRDTQKMDLICSYYIKTLFYHEVLISDHDYWRSSDAVLFKRMVSKLHDAVRKQEIQYFWHSGYNLISHVQERRLKEYAQKLQNLLNILNVDGLYKEVASYLLTKEELVQYNFVHISS